MAEVRQPTTPAVTGNSEYQPLAPLAIAAVAISGIFALLVVIFAGTAMWSGKPVVEPGLLFLAVGGVALSILARVQIDQSEGTRAGRSLTAWAWWLSVLGGAVYAAYLAAMLMAIRAQSYNAVETWFNTLKSGDVTGSFVLTLDPRQQKTTNPRNIAEIEGRFGEAEWPRYRNSELVRIITRNGESAQLIPVAVREWEHQPTGFRVVRSFIMKCPEGEYDISLVPFGHEGGELTRRVWNIKFDLGGGIEQKTAPDGSVVSPRLTKYGRSVAELQLSGGQFISEFHRSMQTRNQPNAYLMTLPADQRKPLSEKITARSRQRQFTELIGGSVLGAAVFPAEKPEGYDSFVKKGIFTLADDETMTDEQKSALDLLWRESRVLPGGSSSGGPMSQPPPRIQIQPDVIQLTADVELLFPETAEYARGTLKFESRNPELLKRITEYKNDALANPDSYVTGLALILEGIDPEFRIVAIETDLRRHSFRRPDAQPLAGANPGPAP